MASRRSWFVVDAKPDPTKAKIHKIIEPEQIFRKTGYAMRRRTLKRIGMLPSSWAASGRSVAGPR
jgi:hypothetical protein